MYDMGAIMFETYMNHPTVKKFFDADEHFDVCIFEIFGSEAGLGIAERFGCVIITYTTYDAISWIDYLTSK